MKKKAPNSPAYTTRVSRFVIAKFRTLKRLRSSIAWRYRDSQKMKNAKITIPAISDP